MMGAGFMGALALIAVLQLAHDDFDARLAAIDSRAAQVTDLTADFEQQKHTALLREPMVSSGVVRVRQGSVLWETRQPRRSSLGVDSRQATVYYPEQKAAEIYPLQAETRLLGASPLPRIKKLREAFELRPIDAADLVEQPQKDWIGLELTPRPGPLKDHVERVRALLDPGPPAIVALEMIDADGDRTVLRFSGVRTNTGLTESDVTLHLPASVSISYPLGPVAADPERQP